MATRTPSLSVFIFDGFELTNPFCIASANFTDKVEKLEKLKDHRPSAVTLKTTAPNRIRRDELDRPSLVKNKLNTPVRTHQDPLLRKYRGGSSPTIYCDGPPRLEYLTTKKTGDLLEAFVSALPDTKIGASVFMGEPYDLIAPKTRNAHFTELNLKYAARQLAECEDSFMSAQRVAFEQVLLEIDKFCNHFRGKPVFIKLTRELPWLTCTRELGILADTINKQTEKGCKVGLIVANTRKCDVPADLASDYYKHEFSTPLSGGILAGEHLYIETYNLIRTIHGHPRLKLVPIIATGGITTLASFIEIVHAGAMAVQIYTALQTYGIDYYDALREDLENLIVQGGFESFEHLKGQLQNTTATEDHHRVRFLALNLPIQKRTTLQDELETQRERWLPAILADLRSEIHEKYEDDQISRVLQDLGAKLQTAADIGLPSLNSPGNESPTVADRKAVQVDVARASFAGHMLAYLLSNTTKGFEENVFDTTSKVLDKVVSGRNWDLALLTEAYVEDLSKRQLANELSPIILGLITSSEYKLCHFEESFEDVNEVYHFDGPEARWILGRFDRRRDTYPIPAERHPVQTVQLLSWLRRGGRRRACFLAKDPLSTAYRLLAVGGPMYGHRTEKINLYLIGSLDCCQRLGREGLNFVYRAIAAARDKINIFDRGGTLARAFESEINDTWNPYLQLAAVAKVKSITST